MQISQSGEWKKIEGIRLCSIFRAVHADRILPGIGRVTQQNPQVAPPLPAHEPHTQPHYDPQPYKYI